jgi:hypothetical protein
MKHKEITFLQIAQTKYFQDLPVGFNHTSIQTEWQETPSGQR